jgi:hypothetical protein
MDERGSAQEPQMIDCAWCARWFKNVPDLLDHIEDEHMPDLAEAV